MIRRRRRTHGCNHWLRRAVTAVEVAIVLPLVMLLMIGLCVAELGAFRYQQIAALAHERARWASVHGQEYARQSNAVIATNQDIFEKVIKPKAKGLDLNKLSHNVQWNEEGNVVTVRIQYTWTPEAFFAPQQLTCTAISLATY